VPNVDGRDRQVIPDGKLCSGGLSAFRGVDLARADWPTTTLTPGAAVTFQYKATLPHEGSFRLYVTKDGYDPTRPLRWADLEATPFLTVTQPKLRDGAYPLSGTLPRKSGRHVILTIWQTTSTVDTYYSCADVVFTAPPAKPTTAAAPPPSPSPSASPVAALAERADGTPLPAASTTHPRSLLPAALGTAGALAATGLALAFFLRRRRTS
jgi:chitin-binding protein